MISSRIKHSYFCYNMIHCYVRDNFTSYCKTIWMKPKMNMNNTYTLNNASHKYYQNWVDFQWLWIGDKWVREDGKRKGWVYEQKLCNNVPVGHFSLSGSQGESTKCGWLTGCVRPVSLDLIWKSPPRGEKLHQHQDHRKKKNKVVILNMQKGKTQRTHYFSSSPWNKQKFLVGYYSLFLCYWLFFLCTCRQPQCLQLAAIGGS